jgi:hypothetical protein
MKQGGGGDDDDKLTFQAFNVARLQIVFCF